MQNSPSDSLHFHATPYGVVRDQRVDVSADDLHRAQAWKDSLEGLGVDRVVTEDGSIRFEREGHEPLVLRVNGEEPPSMGGNTLNTWLAVTSVVGSLQPERLPDFPLHAIQTPKLQLELDQLGHLYEKRGWPVPPALLEITEGARIRCNHVLRGPNGDEPCYIQRTPLPETTGAFPDAPWVFVSSAGSDLYPEILAHRKRMEVQGQTPYLHLAPGSAQVRRGIPEEVLQGVHFLSCNWKEAIQLARHLDAGLGPEPSPYNLVEFFGMIGVDEVRITRGARGTYAWSDQCPVASSAFPRDNSAIRTLALAHGLASEGTSTWTNPDLTGCGDTRLGTELALRYLGIGDLHQQLCVANAMATLQTFNPTSNIGNFPPALIREVVGNVVHHSWVARSDDMRRAA